MAKPKKRGNGYRIRCFRGRTPEGKLLFASGTFATKKEAEAFERAVRQKVATNSYIPPSKLTTGAYLTRWLATTVDARAKEQTRASYERMVKRYLIPTIGNVPLDKLGLADLDGCYASLTRRGLSPRTVRYVHSILRSALNGAMRADLIYRNPAAYATLPKSVKTKKAFLDHEQAGRFLLAAAEDEWGAFWLLLLTTGMRPSEALALKWTDLKDNALTVQRAIVPREEGGWGFDTPKSGRTRVVTLEPVTLAALRATRKAQAVNRLALGDEWVDHGLMFTRSGVPLDLQLLRRRNFRRIVKRAGLADLDPKLTPYSLRHSHITALLSAGESVSTVAERVGHQSTKMTLDTYAHVSVADRQGVADTLAKLMKVWGVVGN